MSCENCANAYDEGYTAGHNAENARLREQAEALAEALEEVQRDCNEQLTVVSMAGNGGLPALSKGRVTAMFNVVYRRAGAALRAYREGDCPGCSFRRQTGGNHDDVPTGDADPNCPYREGS